MADFEKAASKLDDLLNQVLDDHEARLLRSIQALEDKVVNLSSRLSTDADGNIKGPKWTLAQAQELHKQLVREFNLQYDKEVTALNDDYATITVGLKEFTVAMAIDEAFATIDKKMLEALRAQSFKVYETLSDATCEKIAQAVYDAVTVGQSFTTLTANIRNALTGLESMTGRPLMQYASTYAQDALMEYYQTVHNINADAAGLQEYIYYGDVIRDSRTFCKARAWIPNHTVYTKAQIDSWNDLTWAGKKGDVWKDKGGYNCRHHILAVKSKWIKNAE